MRLTKSHLCLALTTLGIALAEATGAELPGATGLGSASGPYEFRLQLVWVCAAIALAVYAFMVYGLVASRGRTAAGAAHSVRAELLWAVVPAVILIGLAAPAIDRLAQLAAEPAPAAAVGTTAPGTK